MDLCYRVYLPDRMSESSDGLGSILEIRHLKAKWTG